MSRLQFDDATHRYTLTTEDTKSVVVPGVTTLLGGGIPKPALVPWAARRVAEYVDANPLEIERLRGMPNVNRRGQERTALVDSLCKVPNRDRDAAAERGTAIHALAEQVIAGHEVEVPAQHEAEVLGYTEFLDRWDIDPVVVEGRGCNADEFYAGTFDLIATSPYWEGPALLDIKTSNGVYGEVALQTAAYSRFTFYLDGEGNERPMPKITRTFVAHVRAEGTNLYSLCDSPEAIDAAYKEFLCAAYIAKTTGRRKKYIGNPLPAPNSIMPA